MKDQYKGNWPGMRLMLGGLIVFPVGLTIILFKEFNIPRYWIVAVIGLLIMIAGLVVNRIRWLVGCKSGDDP